MRTLKFIVNGQALAPDPNCDFSGLVPGTEGYLQAEFSFSSEWRDCAKVVAFYSIMGHEYEPQLLKDGKSCMIPAEALERRKFKIQLTGRRRNNYKMVTNKLTINQNGGMT